MNRLLLLFIFLFSFILSHSQTGYLFVKKGYKKKRTYTEGENIYLRLKNDSVCYGMITRLMNDTIYVSGRPVPRIAVKEVIINKKDRKQFHISAKDLLLITGGVVLVTGGLALSEQAEFKEALIAGTVIGYGPLVVGYIKNKISLKRMKYRMGKKFRLQILDFYLHENVPFKLDCKHIIFNIAAQYDYERPFTQTLAMDKEDLLDSFHCSICLHHLTEMDQSSHYHYTIRKLD